MTAAKGRQTALMPGNEEEAVALVDAYLERATVV